MIEVTPDDSFFSYAQYDNVLVLPITGFVRKDGGLVFVDEHAKEAAEEHPQLARMMGWLVKQDVPTPYYRKGDINFLGLRTREHYAGKDDAQLIEESLWYLNGEAIEKPGMVFYLYPLNEDLELHRKILGQLPNVVLLRKDEHDTGD